MERVFLLALLAVAAVTFAALARLNHSVDKPPSNARHLRSRRPSNNPSASTITVSYEATEQYKSQDGQDKWANEHVFHGKTGGIFVDLGCYDGVTYSNTWYFEKVLNWTGVCVEPNPEVFPRISSQAQRSSGVQLAVSDHSGVAPFVAAYMRSSLNASAVDYNFLAKHGVESSKVNVELVTPSALLSKHLPALRTPIIDYVNIDVEQLELPILRVWPWSAYCVTLFNIENEPPSNGPVSSYLPELQAILGPQGYVHKGRLGVDELFLRKEPCTSVERVPIVRRRMQGTKATNRRLQKARRKVS